MALHSDGIQYVLSTMPSSSRQDNPTAIPRAPTAILFLEIIAEFSNKLLRQDKQSISSYTFKVRKDSRYASQPLDKSTESTPKKRVFVCRCSLTPLWATTGPRYMSTETAWFQTPPITITSPTRTPPRVHSVHLEEAGDDRGDSVLTTLVCRHNALFISLPLSLHHLT